jgi:hypothetical protein
VRFVRCAGGRVETGAGNSGFLARIAEQGPASDFARNDKGEREWISPAAHDRNCRLSRPEDG